MGCKHWNQGIWGNKLQSFLFQFLFFLLKSDFTMACFVVPLHAIQVLSDPEISEPLHPPVCIAQIFVHLMSTCTRSWAITGFMLLHHMHSGELTSGIFFCSTGLPLARTRWVWSTYSSHYPLPSNQRRWITSATLIICHQKKIQEHRDSNLWLLGVKQVCYLCAMQPPPPPSWNVSIPRRLVNLVKMKANKLTCT